MEPPAQSSLLEFRQSQSAPGTRYLAVEKNPDTRPDRPPAILRFARPAQPNQVRRSFCACVDAREKQSGPAAQFPPAHSECARKIPPHQHSKADATSTPHSSYIRGSDPPALSIPSPDRD